MSELPVYDGVTRPDFAGPHQFLSRTPDLDIRVASLGGQSITADRLTFSTLAAVESSDVLFVPGGGCIAEVPSMRDGRVFLIPIRTQVAARSIGVPAMPSVAQIRPVYLTHGARCELKRKVRLQRSADSRPTVGFESTRQPRRSGCLRTGTS
jgi:hypothetical protein